MVKRYELTEASKKQQVISILAQVKTPHGIGIVVEIAGADPNGLYFVPERLKYLVWYGVEGDGEAEITEWHGGVERLGRYISYWYRAEELELATDLTP